MPLDENTLAVPQYEMSSVNTSTSTISRMSAKVWKLFIFNTNS